MAKIGGLGSGVDALFSKKPAFNSSATTSLTSVASAARLPIGITQDAQGKLWADITLLKPNPYQPRKEFQDDSLQELSNSIKLHGVIQPINVQDTGDGSFFIISGERRTKAAKLAGLSKIPVVLGNYTEQAKLEVALIENIQREDINPIEEAHAYQSLMKLSSLTQEQVAERVGKNRATVTNCLRLLKLPPDIQQSVAKGEITSGHARAILSVQDATAQRDFFAKIIKEKLTVRQAENLSSAYNSPIPTSNKKTQNTTKTDTKDSNLKALEQDFIERLGTKVQIKGNYDKGCLVIDYFSKLDLERLHDLILK